MTAGASTCHRCGAALNPSETRGLCPACLLETSLRIGEKPDLAGPVDEAWLKRHHMAEKPAAPTGLRRLGDYELLDEIGRGGMGVIYRARQISLGRLVAVKTILTGPLASPEFAQRFQTEAHTAAVLDHPNIVPIYEVGDHLGQPYYSMRLIPGRNLAQEIKETGAMPAPRAAALMAAVSQAVHYAHQRGVLHRDLKPANILLDAEGNPHVTDFGLAKLLAFEGNLTQTMTVLGTPNYLAPELASGGARHSSVAVDIYGLGAVLYHLLTGRPPFEADSALNTLRMVLDSEPAGPRTIDPRIPNNIEAICLKALSRAPERRYASAAAMAEDLERFQRGEPVLARPITRRQRLAYWAQRNPVAAGLSGMIAFLALALLLGIPWSLWRINAERQKAIWRAEEATEQRGRAEANLRQQQVARIEMLFQTDHAEDAIASLSELYAQNPRDRPLALWIVNELTHRNFALPILGPLVHNDRVCLVCFSPDGRRLLSATRGNRAQVWDASSGRPLGSPMVHEASLANSQVFLGGAHPIYAEFSPDGKWVATGSVDRKAQIWDSETGQPQGAPLPHPAWVTFVRFHPDGKLLATGCEDGMTRLWDVATGQPVGGGFRHEKWVNAIMFSPDGKRVLTASDDNTARVWDVASGKPVTEPLRHGKAVRAAVFSPDGRLVATASSDRTARIWDAETGEPRTEPLRHDDTLNVIQFSPDGRWLATGGFDRVVRIWRVAGGALQCAPLRHDATVRALDFSPDGLRVVTASEDRSARVWDVRSGKPLTESLRHDDVVWSACFSPDGGSVATASSDRSVFIWDVRPGKAIGITVKAEANATGVHWVDDGEKLLTVGQSVLLHNAIRGSNVNTPYRGSAAAPVVAVSIANGSHIFIATRTDGASIWDTGTQTQITPAISHGTPLTTAALSPNERFAATASRDGQVKVWDTATAREIGPPLVHPGAAMRMAISPDNRTLATACEDFQVRLWLVPEGTQLSAPLVHEGWVHDLLFSPDGRSLATASQDGAARVWDPATGKLRYPPLRHRGAVLDVDFSPDGRHLATASRDGYARVWISATGQPRAEPINLGPSVLHAAFSPDGEWLALCGEDGGVAVWDVQTSEPVVTGLLHANKVNVCQFSPNGLRLATGSSDRCVRIWNLVKTADPAPDWLPALVDVVAGAESSKNAGRASQEPAQALRSRLLALPRTDDWARWAHWFLADRAMRKASPLAAMSMKELAWLRIDNGNIPSTAAFEELVEALWMQPMNGDLHAQAAIVLGSPELAAEPDRLATVERLYRRGLAFQAEPLRAGWAQACCLDLAGDQDGAVAVVEQAMATGSDNAYFWLWCAQLLEKAGRIERGAFAMMKAAEAGAHGTMKYAGADLRKMHADYLKRHGLSR